MGEQIPGRTEHTRRRGRRLRALPEVDPASYPPDSVPLEYTPLPDPIRWRGRITSIADLAGDLLAAAVIAVMRRGAPQAARCGAQFELATDEPSVRCTLPDHHHGWHQGMLPQAGRTPAQLSWQPRPEPAPETDALRLEPVRIAHTVSAALDPGLGVGLFRGDDGDWRLSVAELDGDGPMTHVAISPEQMQAVVDMVARWDQEPAPGEARATYRPGQAESGGDR